MEMLKRKITLLGAGSLYFETVIAEIAQMKELAGCSVAMYDIDKRRMDMVRRAGGYILKATKAKIKLTATTDLARALDGADYAISSIGVHGPNTRWHQLDSKVSARFGIIHTTGDTVGPAGLSQGLRIIPIYVKIARQMKKYCPEVILLNHSNPMSPICRAITKSSGIKVIGYCHNAYGAINWFSEILKVPKLELETVIAGPNHMNWLLAIRHNGRDVYPELKRRIMEQKNPPVGRILTKEMLELFDLVPVGGDRHMIEFYPHARRATTPDNLEYGLVWRSKRIDEGVLAREINKEPTEFELRATGKLPPKIRKEVTPESMGEQICALALGREKSQYVNVPNRGAVTNVPDWAVIELKAVIGSHGARPIFVGELPPQAARWSVAQFYTHELLVDAAIEGSRSKAIQALACDPMIANFGEAEPVLDALVEAQGSRLARFRKRQG